MSDPVGFVIKRPVPEDVGDQVIFITRPSAGPFGAAGTAIFACSAIESKGDYYVVTTDKGPVEFSKDLPFLKVPREFTYPVTTTELAKQQLDEKKEWDAVFEADENPQLMSAVQELPDGRKSHNPGQYL